MKQNVEYNPDVDIMAVEQFGYIDLKEANANNVVDTVPPIEDGDYNGIDDPRSIAVQPKDDFEYMAANKVIADYVPPKKNELAE